MVAASCWTTAESWSALLLMLTPAEWNGPAMSRRTRRMSRTARAIAARVTRTGSRMVSRPVAAVARSALARSASRSRPAASDSCRSSCSSRSPTGPVACPASRPPAAGPPVRRWARARSAAACWSASSRSASVRAACSVASRSAAASSARHRWTSRRTCWRAAASAELPVSRNLARARRSTSCEVDSSRAARALGALEPARSRATAPSSPATLRWIRVTAARATTNTPTSRARCPFTDMRTRRSRLGPIPSW